MSVGSVRDDGAVGEHDEEREWSSTGAKCGERTMPPACKLPSTSSESGGRERRQLPAFPGFSFTRGSPDSRGPDCASSPLVASASDGLVVSPASEIADRHTLESRNVGHHDQSALEGQGRGGTEASSSPNYSCRTAKQWAAGACTEACLSLAPIIPCSP
jgi:hypothetical protein